MAKKNSSIVLRNRQAENEMNRIRLAVGSRRAKDFIEIVTMGRGNFMQDSTVPTKKYINTLEKVGRKLQKDETYNVGQMAYELYKNTNSGKWIQNWRGAKWTEEKKGLAMLEQFKINPEDDSGFNDPPWADTKDLTPEERAELFKYHGKIDEVRESLRDRLAKNYSQARRIVEKGHTKEESAMLDKIFHKLDNKQKSRK